MQKKKKKKKKKNTEQNGIKPNPKYLCWRQGNEEQNTYKDTDMNKKNVHSYCLCRDIFVEQNLLRISDAFATVIQRISM